MLAPELRQQAQELIDRYPVRRSALLPLLHLVQSQDGYITADGIAECAELLELTEAEVGAVATFYTMYKRAPMGRHLISVCTNFACKVRGAQEVYDRLSAHLGVGHNQTTADGALTLEHAECLGNCEGAPIVSVDYLNYECLTPDAAVELADQVAAGRPLPPTRGFTPPGVRDIEFRLAGLGPRPWTGQGPRDSGPGHPTNQARASDGAPPVQDAGPTANPRELVIVATEAVRNLQASEPARAPQRDAARDVADSGPATADEVDEHAGPQAREFPTDDPDAAGPPAGDGDQEQPDA